MKQVIIEEIKTYDQIVIFRHVRPDGDAYGSQLGLREIILDTFPEKEVKVVGEESEYLRFLGAMDEVTNDFIKNSLAIIVDTANASRVSDERYKLAKRSIKIDHHPLAETYCDIEWVDDSYSACCEMIAELQMTNSDQLKLNSMGAKFIYTGLVTDTGRFLYRNISSRTLKLASYLLDYKFSVGDLYNDLYISPINEVKFKGYILDQFEYTENGLAYMKIDHHLMEKYQISAEGAKAMVNTLSNIDGINMWIFFVELDEERIRVSLRSRGIVVNEFAKKYNGGGHKLASGAFCDDWDMVDKLIIEADELCKEYNK
ncbi:DHH family phosphoesterase [Haloplasma contractile]|uniref:Bifunctional oligoribonuclease protein n=1 Tax=Haloplasma contractile SSD-17B TaxID=1033810 RepID=F7PVK2_9MOLU|nr:bifunctional oligoribonuclease/PAP phosphatase NrnA [Haloplasma contractile]ERJ12830.1 Bifunctional oligoribonuclease protein [Haloplasma contractile SSD-17B]